MDNSNGPAENELPVENATITMPTRDATITMPTREEYARKSPRLQSHGATVDTTEVAINHSPDNNTGPTDINKRKRSNNKDFSQREETILMKMIKTNKKKKKRIRKVKTRDAIKSKRKGIRRNKQQLSHPISNILSGNLKFKTRQVRDSIFTEIYPVESPFPRTEDFDMKIGTVLNIGQITQVTQIVHDYYSELLKVIEV